MSTQKTANPAHSADLVPQIVLTMERRGLSMRRLAALANLPYKTVQNYLSGRHRIPADALAKLAAALDVSADWLLSGQPAQFNRAALIDALEVVFDFRILTSAGPDPMPQDEAGALFEKYYAKFYQEYLARAAAADDSQHRGEGGGSRRVRE